MLKPTMLTAVAALLLAGPATAMTIYLDGGNTIEGDVITLTEKAVVVSLDGIKDSRLELPLTRVSEFSLYQIKRSRTDRKSATAVEALGDWAMDRGLFTFAMEEYADAVALAGKDSTDALKKKLTDASSRCGSDKLARAKKLTEAGELKQARSFLQDVLKNHPTCPAAEQARSEIGRLDDEIRLLKEKRELKAEEERSLDDVNAGLQTAEDLIKKGDTARRLGLTESGSLGKAEDDFLAAIKSYRRAGAMLAKVLKLPASRKKLEQIKQIEVRLSGKLADVYVDLGHNFIVKGNLVKANHYMGLALAIDPNDPKALALRNAIAMATAGDQWGRPNRR